MIIYGWGNFNRRNHKVVRSTCPNCGHRGYKRSYTSSRFVTLYFVPVIPFGRRKTLAECPSCKQALGMSYGDWKRLERKDLPAAIAAYQESPNDKDKTAALLSCIHHAQSRETLKRFGSDIRNTFAKDPQITAQLAHVYSHLCMDAEAGEAYLHAMTLTDDEELAAEASQHAHLQSQEKPAPPNRILQSLPVLILPAVLLFFLFSYIGDLASDTPSHAYLLNGSDFDYVVTINGESEPIPAGARRHIDSLLYGENQISAQINGHPVQLDNLQIDVPLTDRSGGGPLIVLNPDQAALLLKERMPYSVNPTPDSDYSYTFDTGKPLYVYYDINYKFRDFPAEISLPSASSKVFKTRVSTFENQSTAEIASMLLANEENELVKKLIRAKIDTGSQDATTIGYAAGLFGQDEFLEIAQQKISEYPAQIEWHRAYQQTSERHASGPEIEAEYKALYEKHPHDSAFAYLYGRVIQDHQQSNEQFLKATQLESPTGYAANAIAYNALLEGEFQTAFDYSEQALRYIPDNPNFQHSRTSAMIGLELFDLLKSESSSDKANPQTQYIAIDNLVYSLGALKRKQTALAEIGNFAKRLERENIDPSFSQLSLEMTLALASNDLESILDLSPKFEHASWDLVSELLRGNLAQASQIAQSRSDELDELDHLLLFLHNSKAQNQSVAKVHLQDVIAILAQGDHDDRKWAGWLSGEETPSYDEAVHTCTDLSHHSLYLAAAAELYPSESKRLKQHAARICPRRDAYTVSLQQLLSNI